MVSNSWVLFRDLQITAAEVRFPWVSFWWLFQIRRWRHKIGSLNWKSIWYFSFKTKKCFVFFFVLALFQFSWFFISFKLRCSAVFFRWKLIRPFFLLFHVLWPGSKHPSVGIGSLVVPNGVFLEWNRYQHTHPFRESNKCYPPVEINMAGNRNSQYFFLK